MHTLMHRLMQVLLADMRHTELSALLPQVVFHLLQSVRIAKRAALWPALTHITRSATDLNMRSASSVAVRGQSVHRLRSTAEGNARRDVNQALANCTGCALSDSLRVPTRNAA